MENLLGNLGNAFTNYKKDTLKDDWSWKQWDQYGTARPDAKKTQQHFLDQVATPESNELSEEERQKYLAMNMGEWKKHVGMPEDESVFSDYGRGMDQATGERWEERNNDYIYREPEDGGMSPARFDSSFRNMDDESEDYYPGEKDMIRKYMGGHNPTPGGIGSNFSNLWQAHKRTPGY